jgi:group I intron endonuclease
MPKRLPILIVWYNNSADGTEVFLFAKQNAAIHGRPSSISKNWQSVDGGILFEDRMKTCGIYGILNLSNGKVYIGQTTNLEKRSSNHFWHLRKGTHRNSHLQRAFKKYGENNFKFCILEKISEEFLDERERIWIAYFRDLALSYNLDYGGVLNKHSSEETCQLLSRINKGEANPMWGTHASAETRARMSVAQMGKHHGNRRKRSADSIARIAASKIGHIVSKETRQKMSIAKRDKIFSLEHRQNISIAKKGKSWTKARWDANDKRRVMKERIVTIDEKCSIT